MDEIHRKRLEWMAQAKPGQMWDETLFPGGSEWQWGKHISETSQAALDEIDRLHARIEELRKLR